MPPSKAWLITKAMIEKRIARDSGKSSSTSALQFSTYLPFSDKCKAEVDQLFHQDYKLKVPNLLLEQYVNRVRAANDGTEKTKTILLNFLKRNSWSKITGNPKTTLQMHPLLKEHYRKRTSAQRAIRKKVRSNVVCVSNLYKFKNVVVRHEVDCSTNDDNDCNSMPSQDMSLMLSSPTVVEMLNQKVNNNNNNIITLPINSDASVIVNDKESGNMTKTGGIRCDEHMQDTSMMMDGSDDERHVCTDATLEQESSERLSTTTAARGSWTLLQPPPPQQQPDDVTSCCVHPRQRRPQVKCHMRRPKPTCRRKQLYIKVPRTTSRTATMVAMSLRLSAPTTVNARFFIDWEDKGDNVVVA